MDKKILQTYSTWAKDNLENQIEVSLKALGINDDVDIKKAKKVGDFTVIEGDVTSYSADLLGKRDYIISLINRMGYRNVIEEFAYTWFNRFVALRFMEVHDFLPHGFRVLSNPGGGIEPEILKNLNLVAGELKLDLDLCNEYKQQGKIEELYRYVLLRQCNALSGILPMLFSADYVYLDILLPKTLLKGETVLTKLIDIPESAFLEDVEIIGWMYQFYISSKKDAVYASKKTITEYTLPAVTQLFTPDWIVRYMAQNSVGRLWLESYPDSSLRSKMKYYVEDAEQMPEVQRKLEEIRYKNVNPEDIRIVEPCCGSGHILVYVFDLLYAMYEERGYQKRDIPTLILTNNLTGLDVDKRAVQLASFSLVMKARSVNNHFFDEKYYVTPHVYELQDSKMLKGMGYRKQIKDLNLLNDTEIKLINYLVDTFVEGKTVGSLLKVKPIDFACLDSALVKIEKQAVMNTFNIEFIGDGLNRLFELSTLAKVLSAKYDVMITNPPYIGPSSMEVQVKEYAAKEYPNSKSDMFAMFMETQFTKQTGFLSMINMQSWMFLSSYEKLRNSIMDSKIIVSMLHLGPHGFDSIGGEVVQTTSFVIRNIRIDSFIGTYKRLVDGKSEIEKEAHFDVSDVNFCFCQKNYFKTPGEVFSYWANEKLLYDFEVGTPLGELAYPRQGMATTNNNRFLRQWYEVVINKIGFSLADEEETVNDSFRWFPYNKGGEYRKWYGNNDYVVNFQNKGAEVCAYIDSHSAVNHTGRVINRDKYFHPSVTWSKISGGDIAFRYKPKGFIFDVAGTSIFGAEEMLDIAMAFLNSKVTVEILKCLSPTLNYEVGHICAIPVLKELLSNEKAGMISLNSIELSKCDWDSFETSWDFLRHPLLNGTSAINDSFAEWSSDCQNRFDQLKSNEEELNRIFIDIYGLQDELTPEVEDKDVTVRLADKERDIRSLISYLIGIVMGRYSLDSDGLAYAGGDWDASKYITYQPDDDGIVPIYTKLGMQDGLTTKLIELIKLIYGEDTYRQNIDFIAEALGKNNNESSEETLNRYLNDGFYPDHLKIYQKRPIYWMFSSGKKAGFKCLIYMHRYNEDTLARINAKYYLPESTRKKNELDELNGQITKAEGRDKTRLEKERQNLAAAYNEAIEYGQVLDHVANQYIKIDLDDGVNVNYDKFQGVQLVTDSGTKVKKDLLVPLK